MVFFCLLSFPGQFNFGDGAVDERNKSTVVGFAAAAEQPEEQRQQCGGERSVSRGFGRQKSHYFSVHSFLVHKKEKLRF